MKVLFLRIESIQKRLGRTNTPYAVVNTDMKKPVSNRSLKLWRGLGFKPYTKGIAFVKFEGTEKIYEYPLFFLLPDDKHP